MLSAFDRRLFSNNALRLGRCCDDQMESSWECWEIGSQVAVLFELELRLLTSHWSHRRRRRHQNTVPRGASCAAAVESTISVLAFDGSALFVPCRIAFCLSFSLLIGFNKVRRNEVIYVKLTMAGDLLAGRVMWEIIKIISLLMSSPIIP